MLNEVITIQVVLEVPHGRLTGKEDALHVDHVSVVAAVDESVPVHPVQGAAVQAGRLLNVQSGPAAGLRKAEILPIL